MPPEPGSSKTHRTEAEYQAERKMWEDQAFELMQPMWTPSIVLPSKLRHKLAEAAGELPLPYREGAPREKWIRLTERAAAKTQSLGYVEVEGVRGLGEVIGLKFGGGQASKHLSAWINDGLVVAFDRKRPGHRAGLMAVQVPSLTHALVWSAERTIERLSPQDASGKPLWEEQILKLAVHYVTTQAWPHPTLQQSRAALDALEGQS